MNRRFASRAVLCFALLGTGASADAQYTFTTINYPDAIATDVNNIDNAGRIVGSYQDSGNVTHAYILDNGVFASFDVPNAVGASSANGINSTDQVVGWYSGFTTTKAYIRTGGVPVDLSPFAGTPEAKAYAINDAGRVVGYYVLPSTGNYRGFYYNGRTYTTLNRPNAIGTQAIGINNSDAVVGYYFDGKPHGFLYAGGTYTTIDYPFPGSTGSVAQGINDAGHIAGIYFDASDLDHGFVKTSAGYTTIDYPGAIFTGLVGINNSGQVVGYYRDTDGFHGFLATPVAAADFNGDSHVDGVDLAAWSGNFGLATGVTKAMGDANGDFAVDGADFLVWQTQLTVGSAASTSAAEIPEPSAVLLAALSSAGAANWLRRRSGP